MLSWLAKKLIARNMAQASAGDLGPTLREPWLRRLADSGLQISPDEEEGG